MHQLTDVKSLKRELCRLCGVPRFRQRLLKGSAVLEDADELTSPIDVQMVVLPFIAANDEQRQEMTDAVADGRILDVEKLLKLPQDPNLGGPRGGRLPPLVSASMVGRADVVRLLLEASADKDSTDGNGSTALRTASYLGRADVVRELLEAGASKDLCNHSGSTPLEVASKFRHLETTRVLLEAGADKELADQEGFTPLLSAAANVHVDMVRLLLDAGAHHGVSDNNGLTALHHASNIYWLEKEEAAIDTARLLLDTGADRAATDNDGRTALEYAVEGGLTQLESMLRAKRRRLRAD
ncbi:unnamed protein product [Symbiodinium natans]|uniref:Uncharacterized protein n=1 Tax=Symbiodinium natans TaxID=878477 RepID=A0A812PQ47_9DINO|nr:unnamed protein product [Symbiodinium natans]